MNGGEVRETTLLVEAGAPALQIDGPVGRGLCQQARVKLRGRRAAPAACCKCG